MKIESKFDIGDTIFFIRIDTTKLEPCSCGCEWVKDNYVVDNIKIKNVNIKADKYTSIMTGEIKKDSEIVYTTIHGEYLFKHISYEIDERGAYATREEAEKALATIYEIQPNPVKRQYKDEGYQNRTLVKGVFLN